MAYTQFLHCIVSHPMSAIHALQIRMVCTEYLQYKAALHPVNMRHQVRETNTSRSDQPHWVYQTTQFNWAK